MSAGFRFLIVFGLIAVSCSGAYTFVGSSGNLAASVTFAMVGGKLQVTLTNTSTADVMAPADVLTAVFFDLTGSLSVAGGSAVLATGSTVHFDPDGQPAGGDVGGEWAYKAALSGAPRGATRGISSSGFGLFGKTDRFPGADLMPPESPDGVQYGLTSAGDNPSTGNAPVTGKLDAKGKIHPLIQNSVVFTLDCSGDCSGLMDSIQNVNFQYGTNLSEPNFEGSLIPEPAFTGALAFFGVASFVAYRRRRAKKA